MTSRFSRLSERGINRYDAWLEKPAVDALTDAERETTDECEWCHGIPDDDCDRGRCDDPRVP